MTIFCFQNHSFCEINCSLEGLQVLPHITFYNLTSSGITKFKELTYPLGLDYEMPHTNEMT